MHTITQDEFRQTTTTDDANSRGVLWTGRIMSGIAVAFLTLDGIGKLLQVQPVVDGTRELGYPVEVIFGLGVTLMSCVLVYVVPRTAVLGAILLTGYLGGAIATHVRVANPLFTHVLFPTYVAAFLWAGLMLRDRRLRAFVPWRRQS
jgi:hypothetical protein